MKRICIAAGVPTVPAHGLRGTHARLAVEAGISGDVVAASLGHESFATTAASYAGPDAVTGAAADRVADTLRQTVGPQLVRKVSAAIQSPPSES